ncbi:hypothetical protein CANARDRAFT_27075 [[Candida] arabinofermentans NRRL YB-2248]|uniref:37S ribosomal protein S35, mitochondrial n=1 Tax=[Candida] arabinofermentans NRRL YB-2248 TaxID=983967 RepID=A0A1E4T4Q3_9ASCO|nr:hypothetical protein CANARDRAFT_27075 [[Candida] arabinofermentans NRRL YB-2248]
MISSRSITGLASESRTSSVKIINSQVSQVRYRRTLAYPFYSKAGNIPAVRRGKQTVFKRLMDEFLGPKNFKGDYYLNKYAYPNQDHTTNYIDPRSERGLTDIKPIVNSNETEAVSGDREDEAALGGVLTDSDGRGRERNPLQPFPMNNRCFTNVNVSLETKQQIVNDIVNLEMSSQEVAIKYGLKIQRIEAILKLDEIETRMTEQGTINQDMKKMAQVMYKMFPLYDPRRHKENLTEIPIPEKTLHSRFLTIAESEPFGPVDAAKEFDLEPASVTLQRLSEGGEHSSHALTGKGKKISNKTFIATMHEGDKSAFRFTDVKVGQVGYRYGKTLRDNKKDRKIGFDASGKMVYLLE